MYQAPPPFSPNQRTAKPLAWHGCGLGGLYGFLAHALYGLLLYGLFVLLNQASLTILPLMRVSLIFGISGSLAQAITSCIVGLLLSWQNSLLNQQQARTIALIISGISALIVNIMVMYYVVPLNILDNLFSYGVFLLLPTCIYIALSTHVSAKLNQLWHYNHSENT